MCATSMVIDQYQRTHVPDSTKWLVPDEVQRFWELLETAKEKDIADGNEDCSGPEKQDYLKAVMERLDAIEKRLDGPVVTKL